MRALLCFVVGVLLAVDSMAQLPALQRSWLSTNLSLGTFLNDQIPIWNSTMKKWTNGNQGGVANLTTNANQFLGVPLSIKDGVKLTNINVSVIQDTNGSNRIIFSDNSMFISGTSGVKRISLEGTSVKLQSATGVAALEVDVTGLGTYFSPFTFNDDVTFSATKLAIFNGNVQDQLASTGNAGQVLTAVGGANGVAWSNAPTVTSSSSLTATNTLKRGWVWQGFNTNQALDWAGTNWVIMEPSNTVTLSFANTPAAGALGQTIDLWVYWTNTQAATIVWPSTIDTRSNAPAVVFGITNIYHIWFQGTNFYVLSDQEITTPGANGGAVVLSNAPSIYAPIITSATASRAAEYDAQSHLINEPSTRVFNIARTGAITNAVNANTNPIAGSVSLIRSTNNGDFLLKGLISDVQNTVSLFDLGTNIQIGFSGVSAITTSSTQTNFILNTVYTNGNTTPILVEGLAGLTGSAVNGVSSLDLMVAPSNSATFTKVSGASLTTVVTGFSVLVSNAVSHVVTNGASYYWTNSSAGAGDSAALVAGTGQITVLGGGAQGARGIDGATVTNGWGTVLVTNGTLLSITLTNRPASIATNATSATVDFSDAANINIYNTWFHLTTNLVISPTNLIVGRTIAVWFPTNSLTYDVTVTNTAATPIRWNFNVSTNGSTSFTKTNTMNGQLFLTVQTNGLISADFGYYR